MRIEPFLFRKPFSSVLSFLSVTAAVLLSAQFSVPVQAQTTATYRGTIVSPQSTNTVSGQAIFTIVNSSTLQIDFSNTTGMTLNKADVLSTILFSFSPSVVTTGVSDGITNTATSLLGTSTVINSGTGTAAASQVVNGAFAFGKQTDGDRQYDYGVSSSGFSKPPNTASATANGTVVYGFAGFSVGSGNDDYSMVGASTNSINGGSTVLVKSGVRLTVSGFSGLTSTSQISRVGIGFNSGALTTGGEYLIAPATVVTSDTPEPGALSLIAAVELFLVPVKLTKHRRFHKMGRFL